MAARVVRPKAQPHELLDYADPSTPAAKVDLSHVKIFICSPLPFALPRQQSLPADQHPSHPDKHDLKQEEAREAETHQKIPLT